MKHSIILAIIISISVVTLSAQNYSPCYTNYMSKGQTAFNQGKYKEAKNFFIYAKQCNGGNPTEAQKKINACDAKIKAQLTPSEAKPKAVNQGGALGYTAMFKSNLTLGDGQREVMPYYPKDNPCHNQEVEIANKYIDETLSSALLKEMGVAGFEKEVKDIINANVEGAYNQLRFNPVMYRVHIYDNFNKFFHRIVKIEKVKNLLFDLSSNIICDLCKYYPKDFKAEVVKKIKESISYVSTMKDHNYEALNISSWSNDKVLFIDGVESVDISLGIEGFLIRRVVMDDFTVEELSAYLKRLLAKVEAVDVRNNSDVLKSICVNDDLTYYITAKGNYYLSNKTRKKVLPYNDCEDPYPCLFRSTKVQCIKETNSNKYRISGQSEYSWESFEKTSFLIDDGGEVIQ